jgi:hypothetical protein
MHTNLFRERLQNSIRACLAEAQACSEIDHPGLVGTLRELVVQNLLRPILPEGFYIGTGKITDSRGNYSAQTDIIIYDKRSTPPILYDEKTGIFPIEIVHYSIEVKSKATNTEITESIAKGKILRNLEGRQPHSVFFAFDTDLVQKEESQRFIDPQADIKVPLPINIFCVANRQYGLWDQVWKIYSDESSVELIRGFLVGILNTLSSRLHTPPQIAPGWYFYPDVQKP